MKPLRSRSIKRRRVTAELLQNVWGLDPPGTYADALTWRDAKAYFNHYKELLHGLDIEQLGLGTQPNVLDNVFRLVGLVKHHQQQQSHVPNIKADIAQKCGWILDPTSDDAVAAALEFAVELWLFVCPNFTDNGQTVTQAIHERISRIASPVNQPEVLLKDFSARSLMKKGGFEIQVTSDLTEHLELDGSTIRIFRHARALEKYKRTLSRYITLS